MSRPPVLALRGVRLADGPVQLFDGVDLGLEPRARACLVGRNGDGKSTLLRILSRQIEPDAGDRFANPGLRIAFVPQEPAIAGSTVLDHATSGGALPHDAEAWLTTFGLDAARSTQGLSGGEARRAALARAFAEDPDVLLLDEPTNHLDVLAIETLEREVAASRAAVLVISHDRRFLERVTRQTFWLTSRRVQRLDKGFAAFEPWAEEVAGAEAEADRRLDKQLARETHWLHRGVTARRARNEGRRRRLLDLRAAKAVSLRERRPGLTLETAAAPTGGRLVIVAEGISKSFPQGSPAHEVGGDSQARAASALGRGGQVPAASVPPLSGALPARAGLSPPASGRETPRPVLRPFSTRIFRGDRIAIVGPNGAGKTTLVRLLLGELAPDTGEVRLGTNLQIAYADQLRSRLASPASGRGGPPRSGGGGGSEDATLLDILAPDGGDQIDVRGRPQHVAGYAKAFGFDERQLRQPVRSLSGGERNRLLLARALAQPANLLVLDEPTNDLDLQTLDLLEDALVDYDGTLILVSHDRDFVDRLATSTIALDGSGRAVETPGGWADLLTQNPDFFEGADSKSLPRSREGQTGPGAARGGQGGSETGDAQTLSSQPASTRTHPAPPEPPSRQAGGTRLTYRDARRLQELESTLLPRLAAEIASGEAAMADPTLYARDSAAFDRTLKALDVARAALAAAEDEWLTLEARKEALATAS